jgi:hypothetical protein
MQAKNRSTGAWYKAVLLGLVLWLASGELQAQSSRTLRIEWEPEGLEISHATSIRSEKELEIELHSIRRQLFAIGYFLPDFEHRGSDSSEVFFHCNAGARTEWYGLSFDRLDPQSRSILPDPRKRRKKAFSERELTEQIEILIRYYEDRGYPFIEVGLEDLNWKDQILSASLVLDRGPLVHIDSVHLKGEESIPLGYQKHMLGLRQDMLYNESTIQSLEAQINSTSFLRSIKAPEILFTEEETHLFVYTEDKASSRFDGIVGLVTKDDGRLQLNGHLLLDLRNSFDKGEEIFLEWQAPGNSSQRLKTALVLPYLFKTPFWIDGRWELQRQDSSYLNQDASIGVRYAPRGWEYWKVKWNIISSVALREDLERSFSDFRAPYYGIEWNRDPLRNIIQPKNGWTGKMDISYGRRRVEGDDTEQWRYALFWEKFWNFSGNWVLHPKMEARGLFSDNYLENELIRLGGFRTIRGFPEERFFAAHGLMTRLEQRFLIPGGFLFLSGDFAGLSLPEPETTEIWAAGLAAGLSLGSQSGQFYLSWAMGAETDVSFGKNGSMIHFGYINQF